MSRDGSEPIPEDRPVVRPREVWLGLAGAVVGAALIGVGLTVGPWWVLAAGVVLLAAGGLTAWHGGVLYDAHSSRGPGSELDDVVAGRVHEGVSPQDRMGDPKSERAAQDASTRLRHFQGATRSAPAPSVAPLGALLLLVVAAFLFGAQGPLYPNTPQGRVDGVLDLGVAVVVALVALRVLVGRGRHPWAAATALLAGAALLVLSLVTESATPLVAWTERVSAVLVLVGGALCLAGRR